MKELLDRIERYFDCSLSDEEERALRRDLALIDSDAPVIQEAKAVMGFSAIRTPRREKKRRWGVPAYAAAAAIAAILLGGGLFFTLRSPTLISGDTGECIAYVNGERVTDEQKVMEILFSDMAELNEGAEEAREDVLDDLADIIPITEPLHPTGIRNA